ncbi:hypothetical protein AALP_AA1G069400 [Arabis alpina]|uniref:Transmembrane protein n=1 Tax=Arabis alpina TaxID=50452 RepID=A0A087HLM5_ARAAL|nr:hypothetical protein AALP_AA1G069400 [Arabis alpina]
MGLRRTFLVLYILFIFHHNFLSVRLRATNHVTLPLNVSKSDIVGFEVKSHKLAVVIKRRGGGGGGGGGRGGREGGGGGRSRSRGGRGVIYPAGSHSRHSNGNKNLQGARFVVGLLSLSVLVGLYLVKYSGQR